MSEDKCLVGFCGSLFVLRRETRKRQTGNKLGKLGLEAGGSLSLVLFNFLIFCTHRTSSLCLSCFFADTYQHVEGRWLLRSPLYSYPSVLFPSSIQTLSHRATFWCLRACMVCLEKPWLSVTSVTGKWEDGFKNPENTSAVCAYTKTSSFVYTHPHPPWSLFHTDGTTWRKIKWDQIQGEWEEDSSYYLTFTYSFPISFLSSLLTLMWLGLLEWNQDGSSSALCHHPSNSSASWDGRWQQPGNLQSGNNAPSPIPTSHTDQAVSAPSL